MFELGKDNDIKFVTVTAVNVTNDLSFAKVYVTVLADDKKEELLGHDNLERINVSLQSWHYLNNIQYFLSIFLIQLNLI